MRKPALTDRQLKRLGAAVPSDNLRAIFLLYHAAFWSSRVNQAIFCARTLYGANRGPYKLRVKREGTLASPEFAIYGGSNGKGSRLMALRRATADDVASLAASVTASMPRQHDKMMATLVAGGRLHGNYEYHRRQRGGTYDDVKPMAYVTRIVLEFLERHDVPIAPAERRLVIARVRTACRGDGIPPEMWF